MKNPPWEVRPGPHPIDGYRDKRALCPRCHMDLEHPGIVVKQGPDNQWAHDVYFGGDWGGWCMFRVRPTEIKALKKIAREKRG